MTLNTEGMARFKKTILNVDTYHSPEGEVVVTPERLKHWESTFQTFQDANITVPVAWDHPDDPDRAKPIEMSSKKHSAQNNIGRLESFTVTEDGNAAEVVLDIPAADDAGKVEHNLAEISPVIFRSWTDGAKRTHEDCITHVDLVNHPVDNSQSDFVACSTIRMGLDEGKPQTYRLATDLEPQHGIPVESDRLASIIEALAGLSVVLAEDTNGSNFFDRLESALLTRSAMEDDSMSTSNLEQEKPTEIATLSATPDGQVPTKPVESPELKFIRNQHRETLRVRMSALVESGRCTPKEAEDKLPSVDHVTLSITPDGDNVPSVIESWIQSREELPEGVMWDPKSKSQRMSVEDQPDGLTGDMTEEQADELVEKLFSR